MYICHAYIHIKDKTYNGTGSKQRNFFHEEPDLESAQRWAKNMVESGRATFVSVTPPVES